MNKEVRLANRQDFDFIYDSLREDLEGQGILHRFHYSKTGFMDAIFGEKPLAVFLILLIDGERAGFASYSIDYRNFTVNTLANLYLNDLFVKKPYRRMRGAALLIDKLKEIAKQENCGRIEWFVQADNTNALTFYQNFLGAKIISHELNYMRLLVDNNEIL